MGVQRRIRMSTVLGALALVSVACGSIQQTEVAVEDPAQQSDITVEDAAVEEATAESTQTAEPSSSTVASSTTMEAPAPTTTVQATSSADAEVVTEFVMRTIAHDVKGAHELVDPEFSSAPLSFSPATNYQWDRWWGGPEFDERAEFVGCVTQDDSITCEWTGSNGIDRAAGLTNVNVITAEVTDGVITSYVINNQLGAWYGTLFTWMANNRPDETACTTDDPLAIEAFAAVDAADPFPEEFAVPFLEACFDHMLASVEAMISEPSYVPPGN